MRVLVACEYSGRVREAFRRRRHDAWSVDLFEDAEDGSPHHIKADALAVLSRASYDLLIAHPPCTDLAVSGARYFAAKRADGRQQKAIDFVKALWSAQVPRICIENPVGVLSTYMEKPTQIIQPWMFGEDASKKTCLWLKGLSPLTPTNIIAKDRYANQTPSGQNNLAPSPERWKERSRTYQGIADAMAEQWG